MATVIVCFSYPDTIAPKRGLHASRQQSLAMDRVTFVPPPQRAWGPFYPTQIARRVAHPSRVPFGLWAPLGDSLPKKPLSWRGIYPDRIPHPVRRRPDNNLKGLFPTTIVVFGWRGVYPDAVDRLAFPTSQQRAWVMGGQSAQPIPDPRWLTRYPDRIQAKAGLTTGSHLTWAQNVSPLPNAPSPELAWGPWYPDRVLPPQGLSVDLQQPKVLEPIKPFMPTLSWQGWQPVEARGAFLPSALQTGFVFQRPIIAPDIELRWFTHAVDLFRPQRRPVEYVRPVEVPVSPVVWLPDSLEESVLGRRLRSTWLMPWTVSGPGGLILIGERQGWQPSFPDRFWMKSSVQILAGLPPRTEPILPPGSAAGCTILRDEFLLAPTLEPNWLMASTLANEFMLAPSFASEEFC